MQHKVLGFECIAYISLGVPTPCKLKSDHCT